MGLLDIAGPIVSKLLAFIPDPAQKAAAQLALLQAQQAGEFKQIDADLERGRQQTDIDKAEAQSTDPLQHWRGGLGWVCVLAYLNNFVLQPYAVAFGFHVPALDSSALFTLTGGMLGLGGMHVYQTVKGAA